MDNNMLDYVYWRGDLSLSLDKFNEVDALILNMVSFIEFHDEMPSYPSIDNKKIKKLIEEYFETKEEDKINLGLIVPKEILTLAKEVSHSRRFENILACNFVNVIDYSFAKQFSAMTFILPNKEIYVSFKGTDDTLIGWAEDVNLLINFPIPAQQDACDYLNRISELYPDYKIFVGGHSKGGNLSIYAATYCKDEVKDRILKIYTFDGPGFDYGKLDVNRFNMIKEKVIRIIPKEGIVGRFFDLDVEPKVVKSHSKGLNQHNPFFWIVEKNAFKRSSKFSSHSDKIDVQITELIAKISEEDKVDFANDLNKYMNSLNQNNLIEFASFKSVLSLFVNKHKMKAKNIRYLIKLYSILSRNKAVYIKLNK